MFNTLPEDPKVFMEWGWDQIEPVYRKLDERALTAATIDEWMLDWSRLADLLSETGAWLQILTTLDTSDEQAEKRFHTFLETIDEASQPWEQRLRQKLLASGLTPRDFAIPLRGIKAAAETFCEANIPLFTEEQKLVNNFDSLIGAQTVQWNGEERTLPQMRPLLQSHDRAERERAWRLVSDRQLADREALSQMWQQFLRLRVQQAQNAGYPDYRAFQWLQLKRFDYTPQDCLAFGDAIEQTVVPAVIRLSEQRRQHLGVESLRPWDLDVDPLHRPPLRPFSQGSELEAKSEAIFRQVDPQLGEYLGIMRREGRLDLDNRKNKAPGGYQADLAASRRPFIFMNAVGLHDDVQTMLHEGGHAFHCFEAAHLPYGGQREFTNEIAEVASMAMELLAAPYLTAASGGFYSEAEAARARIEHLDDMLRFWPYMAVVDGFQHWVYTHADEAADPAACDAAWGQLWTRFMAGVDWSGLEAERVTGWQRKQHIFTDPFYYIDYGLAQVGAVQIWRNALTDQAAAVRQYRQGLALGATRTLPELFAAAGGKWSFDVATLRELVDLIESTIEQLEQVS